ncbi:MAG: aminomethyl-transferring glycine dehydrogenase subunit GcvPA [Phycisphaeraceae bacterium]|nr:aminomethyl-transferring glycine dehydrogenase subunit GcvPA [Phycisphaeraceae bacterium]
MNYVQLTTEQRQEMLAAIGVGGVKDLYASLPPEYRLGSDLKLEGLPKGLSELELRHALNERAGGNNPAAEGTGAGGGNLCFLGGGAYDHFIPQAVNYLAHQSAFVTAYTPYQAEASQGALQAFFEFQTQVTRLTGLEVSNASLYEGATAVVEGVLMAVNSTGKRKVLVAGSLHPDYLAVLRTYLGDLPVELEVIPAEGGRIAAKEVEKRVASFRGDVAAVVVQSPNVLGLIEDWEAIFAAAKKPVEGHTALAVAVFNPIACGLLKRPGDCGADIAAGDGQPLGIPLSFGGPYLGLFAAKAALMRKMPGRLIGQTVDKSGRRGFCLTLQTREQHIRGAKATSNICTNQGLLAMRATVYLSAMGPAGLREVAEQCYHKAHYAAEKIADVPGYKLAYSGAFFHEFVVDTPVPAQSIIDLGRARGILPGLDAAKLGIGHERQLLVAVTEKRTAGEIDALVELLTDATKKK